MSKSPHVADDLGAAVVAVLLLHLVDVLADDVQEQPLVAQDGLVALDLLDEVRVVVGELLDLQAGEPLELHGQDGVGLHAGEVLVGSLLACLTNASGSSLRTVAVSVRRRACAISRSRAVGTSGYFLMISMISSMSATAQDQAFQDVRRWRARRSRNIVRRRMTSLRCSMKPTSISLQAQRPRRAVDQGDVDDAEGRLQRRVLVELVDDDFRLGALLELDDDPHAGRGRCGPARRRCRESCRPSPRRRCAR